MHLGGLHDDAVPCGQSGRHFFHCYEQRVVERLVSGFERFHLRRVFGLKTYCDLGNDSKGYAMNIIQQFTLCRGYVCWGSPKQGSIIMTVNWEPSS